MICGKKITKQLIMLFSLIFTVNLIVFSNSFFVYYQYFLLLLASLYFAVLLGMDLFIAFFALKHRYALLLIFGYITLSRIILCNSTSFFPFYWTLTMHLLPFMNTISQFILPLLWESLCVSFAAIFCLPLHKQAKYLVVQVIIILLIVVSFSTIVKKRQNHSLFNSGLECIIIQGGYSSQDYDLVERYPGLGVKMVQRYLNHIEEVTNARFLILPESAFPLVQTMDGEILQEIENKACIHNEYIMSGILLEEGENVYNAAVLIDPKGYLQSVYRKRNPVLFVETTKFTKGVLATNFTVDGHTIAPLICYESVFFRNYFREKRPEIYIVLSNDVFAERTILSKLHQAYSVINARTIGIPLLQVIQNGPSFYVDSQGRLSNLTRPYEQAIGLSVEIR
jgi:apolipoprotein N-acyltransferase